MAINQSGSPIGVFIDLATAKLHMVVEFTDDDTIIQSYIDAAEDYLERVCGTVFRTTEFTFTGTDFNLCFENYPNAAISSVTYEDSLGATISVVDYSIVDDVLTLETTPTDVESVTVVFTAGLGAGNVPASLTTAAILIAAGMYEERAENTMAERYALSFGVKQLIAPHRVFAYG
ncbi:MAG: head-tail connector protein [Pseudomonadota bacterium]